MHFFDQLIDFYGDNLEHFSFQNEPDKREGPFLLLFKKPSFSESIDLLHKFRENPEVFGNSICGYGNKLVFKVIQRIGSNDCFYVPIVYECRLCRSIKHNCKQMQNYGLSHASQIVLFG